MTSEISQLTSFGWSPFFSQQLALEEVTDTIPVRVTEVQRGSIRVMNSAMDHRLPPFRAEPEDDEAVATVGDWILLDGNTLRPIRLLERKNLFKRRAPGTGRHLQLIAANVDTIFIVSSCNQDFNLARLKRYLVLARAESVEPVIVLTKSDLTATAEDYAAQAAAIDRAVIVETLDARDRDQAARLDPWLGAGQTVALVGSSGVGKSTLTNTLLGDGHIKTRDIRGDDDKGRHTTSSRILHPLPGGAWLLDSPGMREFGLVDAAAGLDDTFPEVAAFARDCRFSDCRHESEPGCAVREAIEEGALDPWQLRQWQKLAAEEAYNTETLAERRQRTRDFGKMVRRVLKDKNQHRDP